MMEERAVIRATPPRSHTHRHGGHTAMGDHERHRQKGHGDGILETRVPDLVEIRKIVEELTETFKLGHEIALDVGDRVVDQAEIKRITSPTFLPTDNDVSRYVIRAIINYLQNAERLDKRRSEIHKEWKRREIMRLETRPAGDDGEPCERDLEYEVYDRFVETLGEQTAKVWGLRFLHGFPYAKIAEMLEIAVSTVHELRNRAMRRLEEFAREHQNARKPEPQP
jgi:RNA polymerase sigma factor (sigma-70 family)